MIFNDKVAFHPYLLLSYKYIVPLLDEWPDRPAYQVVGNADQPGLGPVQVRMGRLFAGDAQCVEGVVRRPFALERFDGPVPDLTVGVLFAHGD